MAIGLSGGLKKSSGAAYKGVDWVFGGKICAAIFLWCTTESSEFQQQHTFLLADSCVTLIRGVKFFPFMIQIKEDGVLNASLSSVVVYLDNWAVGNLAEQDSSRRTRFARAIQSGADLLF